MEASEAAAMASAALNETLGEKGKEEEKSAAAPSKKEKERKRKKEEVEVEVEKKKKTKKAVIIIPPLLAAPEAPATPPFVPPSGWWGNSFFVHAGRLEGILDSKEDAKKKSKSGSKGGFTTADQEALAERTTALKAAGKRGLGAVSSKKEKAVGHEWKGSKVVFGDGENDDGDGENDGAGDEKHERKKQKKDKKKRSKETSPPASSSPLDVSSLKWKKAVKAAISTASKSKKGLPVAELAGRVAAALSAKQKTTWSKRELEAALNRSLRSLCDSSSLFDVDGKGRVKLTRK